MSARRRASLIVALCSLSCGDAGDTNPPSDSDSSRSGVPVSVGPEAILRVGKADGTEADILNRVVTPFLLNDGRLVIPVAGDQGVRIYSAQGEFEQTLGSRGEGPGEFMSIDAVWAVGDTIEVWDPGLQRMTRFLNGRLLEAMRLDASGRSVPGRFAGGWVFTGLTNAEPVATTRPPGSVKIDTVAFYHIRPTGPSPVELTRIPGLTRYVTSRQLTQPEPLSPQPRFGLLDDLLLVGYTLEPGIRGVDSRGAARFDLQWDLPTGLQPAEAHEAVLDAWRARATENSAGSLDYTDAPVPGRVSAYWDFLVDSEGFTWVLLYDPLRHAHALGGWRGPGPGGHWFVFDRSGNRVSELDLPARLYPSQILKDHVVGIERDELGVESVAVYTLIRR